MKLHVLLRSFVGSGTGSALGRPPRPGWNLDSVAASLGL
jgi:hypothetical protein